MSNDHTGSEPIAPRFPADQSREAALRDILRVIIRSRDDELPVFEAILENASRLCHAPLAALGLISPDGQHYEVAAQRGAKPEFLDFIRENPPELDPTRYAAARAMVEMRTVHIDDLADPKLYGATDRIRSQSVALEGVRTTFYVPLILEGRSIGALMLYRRVVSPFSDDDIALVETFAEQAVIAIENVRQFRELKTRLEREAATRDVLEVISRSRDDEQPVFDVILENAARLCNAPHAFLALRNEEDTHLEFVAESFSHSSVTEELRARPYALDDQRLLTVQVLNDAEVRHIPDLALHAVSGNPTRQLKLAIEQEGVRTLLYVPLLKDSRAIGLLGMFKREVAPFKDDEIALVETFAAQAVIAVENVRQFKALEALNAELGDRVAEQVGEIERMGRLKRFLSPAVADAVVSAGQDGLLRSHRALIATLFCDIRGFTAFCESAEPEETIDVLQTFHEAMGELLRQHGAGVDQRAGDGIMAIFNDPLPCEHPAGDAVRMALAMRSRMEELCAGWKRLGHRLGFGVGISLGYATVGMVGSGDRLEYTASGTAVNVAARLCDEAGDGEILLSTRAFAAVEGEFEIVPRGEITLKGIHTPVEVHKVIAPQTA